LLLATSIGLALSIGHALNDVLVHAYQASTFPPKSEENPTEIEASHRFSHQFKANFRGSRRDFNRMEGYPSVHPDGKSLSSSDIPPEKNPTVEA
jgi:hypothetical protein